LRISLKNLEIAETNYGKLSIYLMKPYLGLCSQYIVGMQIQQALKEVTEMKKVMVENQKNDTCKN